MTGQLILVGTQNTRENIAGSGTVHVRVDAAVRYQQRPVRIRRRSRPIMVVLVMSGLVAAGWCGGQRRKAFGFPRLVLAQAGL